jgi:hypothetical protein
MIDLHPNKENKNFKQAAFDFIDGKITEKQFRDAYWNYRLATAAVAAMPLLVVVAVAAGLARAAEYYRPYFEQHASLLNKLIQEYQS